MFENRLVEGPLSKGRVTPKGDFSIEGARGMGGEGRGGGGGEEGGERLKGR